jgi:sucrose synthase
MSRLDKIKNITGLIKWFGESETLQKNSNLIIAAGKINSEESTDNEEKEEINLTHELLYKYNLHDKVRWIGRPFSKVESGEAYRLIADKKGIFVQPALFEGFGLTVIEAMTTGIPVFATKYGGPLEIIQNNINGFHIDPVNDLETINILETNVKKIIEDPDFWKKISVNSIKRVEEKYNWPLYTKKLLSQAKIYGFWKYSTDMENKGMEAYLDLFYHTVYKPRAKELLEKHNKK